jgi:predicted nucleic acid-binding protein
MKILLDTCTFLWIVSDAPELTEAGKTVFSDPDNDVYLSSVSAWEILVKYLLEMLHQNKGISISQADWLIDNEFRFEIRQSGKRGELARKIVQTHSALEDVARASLGTQAYNSSKHTRTQIYLRPDRFVKMKISYCTIL